MSLSERQQKILEFVKSFTLDNGYPPTIREIGKAVNISSTSVVNYNLDALQRAGLITRDRTVSRGIRLDEGLEGLTTMAANLVKVPMLGRIAAGEPLLVFADSIRDSGDTIDVPRDMLPTDKDIYALEVQGTSMIDALINDGDIVIMRHTQSANNGDMVAAWLPEQEETTLKRFFHEGKRIRLQPENQTMQPIYVDPDKIEIKGRVVAVLRQLE
ncbi:MAG: LexA repressor [Anaerolineae bacterium]|nr:LexA repressor [Anaerolineae bacterium]